MRTSILAALLLFVLSLVDATLTSINIERFGMSVEFNPLIRYLIELYGLWIMFVLKGFFGLLLLFLLSRTTEQKVKAWVIPLLMWMVGAYSVIVFYGYCILVT